MLASVTAGKSNEKNISAQHQKAQKKARVSCPYAGSCWPCSHQKTAQKRAYTPLSLTLVTILHKSVPSEFVGARENFPKTGRICRKKDFDAVFRNTDLRSQRSGVFVVHLKRNGLGYSRLGLCVSRRVSKKAVERNRIKRAIRESFRKHEQADLDMVVVCKPSKNPLSQAQLSEFLRTAWEKVLQTEKRSSHA